MKYKVIEVSTPEHIKQFYKVARNIYRNDKNFICPPDAIIEGIFNPKQNTFFSHGQATRWILENENGDLVGRIAAFINEKKAYTFSIPTGGMGFFECIDDYEAAKILFDTSKKWLSSRGMKAMDGPINFGENDNFWGLLVDGFMPQSFGMNYNPPYYKSFFEKYGFSVYFEQITNHLDLTVPFPERFWKIADWVMARGQYEYRHFTYEQQDKFIKDFEEIYNDAWQFHENFTPVDTKDVKDMIGGMKSFAVPEFIWFAYHDNEPVAFELMIPDLNQLFKQFNGTISFWDKLKILFKGKKSFFNRTRIVIMGVKPKYQKSGVESGMFKKMDEVMKCHPQYKEIELSWVGDFNPKMRALQESVGAKFAKKHITYRYYFDKEDERERSSIIAKDTREKIIEKE